MIGLSGYKVEIEAGERGVSELPRAAFGVMYNELKSACWQPGYREEALELQSRAERLAYHPESPLAD